MTPALKAYLHDGSAEITKLPELLAEAGEEILHLQEVNQFLKPDEETRRVQVLAIQGQKKEIEWLSTRNKALEAVADAVKELRSRKRSDDNCAIAYVRLWEKLASLKETE